MEAERLECSDEEATDALVTTRAACAWLVDIADAAEAEQVMRWLVDLGMRCDELVRRRAGLH